MILGLPSIFIPGRHQPVVEGSNNCYLLQHNNIMVIRCLSCAKSFSTQRSLRNHCSQTGCLFKAVPTPLAGTKQLSFHTAFSSMPMSLSSTSHTISHLFAEKNLQQEYQEAMDTTKRQWILVPLMKLHLMLPG